MRSRNRVRALLGAAIAVWLLVPAGSALAQSDMPSVNMSDDVFNTKVLHISSGQSVTWTNSGANEHTVTADDQSFDSGDVDPGATFTQEFDTPGTYQYYCTYHGNPGLDGMAGEIIVDAS